MNLLELIQSELSPTGNTPSEKLRYALSSVFAAAAQYPQLRPKETIYFTIVDVDTDEPYACFSVCWYDDGYEVELPLWIFTAADPFSAAVEYSMKQQIECLEAEVEHLNKKIQVKKAAVILAKSNLSMYQENRVIVPKEF